MNRIFGLLTIFFVGAIVMGLVLNAAGASKVFGSLFSGTATLGSTLEGNIPSGSSANPNASQG